MFWADKIANELSSNVVINDSKTPSGRVHVGSLRGVIIHYIIAHILKQQEKKPTLLYGFDDYDPMDALPFNSPKIYLEHMGKPLCNIPSPDGDNTISFADHYTNEFVEVIHDLDIYPQFYKTSHLYRSGQMNEAIEILLNHEEAIRNIYFEMSGSKKSQDWHPFQVICQQCQKIGTTLVHSFDQKEVEYTCEPNLVKWAKGCNYHGKVSPFDGNGKLPWKIEWAAKWKVLNVGFEAAGKDHSSAGGSRDVSSAIFRRVFQKEPPYDLPYEFFLIKKQKMSSSKGLGSSSREVSRWIPPELLRFLMMRFTPNSVIDFEVGGNTIPKLFDEYDRSAQLYYDQSTDKTHTANIRTFELSQIKAENLKPHFFPRFSTIVSWLQIPNLDLQKKFEELNSQPFQPIEKKELQERIRYAEQWTNLFANPDQQFKLLEHISDEMKQTLSSNQKDFFAKLIVELQNLISQETNVTPEIIHECIYSTSKNSTLLPKEAFQSLYFILNNRKQGPRLGNLIYALDLNWFIHRLNLCVD